jgi:hypothetical protein
MRVLRIELMMLMEQRHARRVSRRRSGRCKQARRTRSHRCRHVSPRVVGRSRRSFGSVRRRGAEDKRLLEAVGKADAKATETIRAAIVDLDVKLDAIDKSLAKKFPEYPELSSPKPLGTGTVQTLLRPDEALVVFLDIPRLGMLPEETLAWAVTKTQVRWISIPQGTAALTDKVSTLRRGLSPKNGG